MGIWQKVTIWIWAFYLVGGVFMDGKEKREKDGSVEKHSFISRLADVLLWFIILYFGGFFK